MDEIDVQKVAKLARLKLNKEDEAYFKAKFNSILEYVGKIAEVDISDEMKEKDESLQRIYRPDTMKKSEISLADFSDYVENGFFKVPKVIE